jgi:pescadillo protein
MLTFFEFYETLLGFVLYKLYGDLGVRYPLPTVAATDNNGSTIATLHPALGGKASSVLAANLNSLQIALNDASKGNSAANAVKDALQMETNETLSGNIYPTTDINQKTSNAKNKKKQKQLMQSIDEALKGVTQDDESENGVEDEDGMEEEDEDQIPIAAPLREALEAIDDSTVSKNEDGKTHIITDPEARKRHQLFNKLTFFLSREIPRGYLELIILSYGGQVGWEGQDSPIVMEDSSITHHIVDRPKLLPTYSKLPKSREYIQPQWILDSANFNFILPIHKYSVGAALPPHLSPWVDDKEEGYVPKYKEEIEKLRNGEMMDGTDDEKELANESVDDGDESIEENGELAAQVEKKDDRTANSQSSDDEQEEEDEGENENEEEEEEEDEETERKALSKKRSEVRLSK